MQYGKRVWVFPDAELPPEGVDRIPGHESVIITNTCDEAATVHISLLFPDREPERFSVSVAARRVRCLRTNQENDFGSHVPQIGEQYAIVLESNVPIVAQYGRAEPRAIHFYTTPGYCE